MLPTSICKSLNCCLKNEELNTKNSVLESLILRLLLIIQVLMSEMHKLIFSNAILGSDRSNLIYYWGHRHKCGSQYHDGVIWNLLGTCTYKNSMVPGQNTVEGTPQTSLA